WRRRFASCRTLSDKPHPAPCALLSSTHMDASISRKPQHSSALYPQWIQRGKYCPQSCAFACLLSRSTACRH
ncbi:hypothetical protein, partial [Legionella pneumophila]|uniref:hypothetical protein n=1 Tax=Legionella pneumophila TaxID=446 RepID=UPI001E4143B3